AAGPQAAMEQASSPGLISATEVLVA
nr:TCDD-aryl hydrocarbon hydroxylase, P-450 TCDD-AHH=2,3,7,8-tetrachlorodibenzo-p-dioxin-induced 54.5 kda isoform {N-terminal} [chickens, White Leghorn, embryo, liver microsomes, Peptide Partial, 25 aa] [Gallus gallus]